MKLRSHVPFVLVVLAMLLALAPDGAAQQTSGAMFAASDGKGHISLLWFPSSSRWPASWRLLDSSGKVLVSQIASGDAAALQNLPLEDADAIRKLPEVLAKSDTTAAQRSNLINILGIRTFSEPVFARALGLSWSLDNVAPGNRAYKVEGLDAAGKSTGLELTSAPVDSARATPLPPAPTQVEAKGSERGVGLSWAPVAENRQLPVLAYIVERDGAAVTAKPVVVGARVAPKASLVLDRAAPRNQMLSYQIFSVDVFGRRSEPGSIRIFFPDLQALVPPDPVTATPAPGKVVVSWKAKQKPNLTGYVVERSFLENGPYEALTTPALAVGADHYEDASVRGGTSYYYRVRGVGPRGDLGPPSHSSMAQPSNPGKPPKVAGLAADAGQTRVRLTWQPASFPLAGYFVERRGVVAAPALPPNWVRLNPHVTPEPLYDDYSARASDTKLEYRIVAVAFDNTESPASDSVTVALANLTMPDAPTITAASGAGGKVQLSFAPAPPEESTAQFLVLRAGSAEDLGVVIGNPLPGSARQFEDLYVSAGESYWYRLVALDKSSNRSDPTAAVVVRVGAPAIPKPATPALQFSASPNPHVTVQFAKAPAGLAVVVERQFGADNAWLRVAGPLAADQTSIIDNAPPDSHPLAYRVALVSAGGQVGPASDPATLK